MLTGMGYDWHDKTTVIFGGYVGGLNEEEFSFGFTKLVAQKLWEEYRMQMIRRCINAMAFFPAEIFLHSKKKVTNLEEYKGISNARRAHGREVGGSLGATTVILPGSEVYPALERGVIDATEWSSPSMNEPVGATKSLNISFSQVFISPVQHRNVNLTRRLGQSGRKRS